MTLVEIPTAELLAELDRRVAAAGSPVVHFFGVWPGERAGHYLYDKHGTHINTGGSDYSAGRILYPWDYYQGPMRRRPQVQGTFWHWHHAMQPLTMLLSWDRSADARGGCAASFVVHAHVTPEQALAFARADFPRVFERIETHLGKPVTLAGKAEG